MATAWYITMLVAPEIPWSRIWHLSFSEKKQQRHQYFNWNPYQPRSNTRSNTYTLFLYKHTGKLGWSSICLRFSQFEPEIVLDGMLNFKTHFRVWYCVWSEHCNLVSSLILMFIIICLCDAIIYTWFGKKWKRLKKFWGWKICLFF